MNYRAVFLDRDGTIIEDTHYVRDPKLVHLLPGAAEGLKILREQGFLLFVISNQSGVGRGIIKEGEFHSVHAKVCELLQQEGVQIDEFEYCFHKPEDQCECRKPGTALIRKEFQGKKINLSESYVVGDSECDVALGEAIGAQPVLVLTGKGVTTQATISESLLKKCWCHENLLSFANRIPR